MIERFFQLDYDELYYVFDNENIPDDYIILKTIVNAMIDNSGLANAPVKIRIKDKLYGVTDFYYDKNIEEYVMELTGGYEYEENGIQ